MVRHGLPYMSKALLVVLSFHANLTTLSDITTQPPVTPRSSGSLGAEVGTPSIIVTLIAYRDTFQPLGSPAIQLAPKNAGVPVVKP
jgi:hypothetical protein